MATEITMPKLSDTMTEGSFIGWRKKVGERVERGEVIAEVETDKAVMELEAFTSGVLLKTMAQGGENVPVGTVLGLIGEPGELSAGTEAPSQTAAPAALPSTKPSAPLPQDVEPPPQPVASAPLPSAGHEGDNHEKASPLVRRMAREMGIDLSQVRGSGPEGRILQDDLAAPAAQPETSKAQQTVIPPDVPAPVPPDSADVVPLAPSAMRQAIAATVSRSWRDIPYFTAAVEVGMEACREVVGELKGSDGQVGYHALLIKACGVALKGFPLLMAGSADGPVNISFAVALPDGLLMPVVKDCARLGAAEIEREAARLADKARGGRLTAEEMSGGGFSISNLGMYGVDEFDALIVPGQVAILAVGAVAERPVVRNGQLGVAPTVRITLSSDHRVVDGAYAARFLAELRRVLEHPVLLLAAHGSP
ncbi:dihydrolipoamide acetyltransferase family protein [Geobacter sp. AOG2]|uniref:dihydrolipoamide acetyltransferase family protein n=1 Tax=Geobacter sp. AOG2 TaxID=1566347 RepID=UPI001CC5EDF6|nr:dihydrolipoamide acetyltransferase family protein [Geobacter sp. AOG2]GFE60082.1 dihydrolipoamide acetyltransferase component of pyruvate dehydrogenase complex [Geobacter sp. AOG2]